MRNADIGKMLNGENAGPKPTRGALKAINTMHRWARMGFEEGQTEAERREDIAASEGPRVDDTLFQDVPGELNV